MDESIKKYIKEVEKLYASCKEKRLGRLSIEWGKPSARLNRELRKMTRAFDNDDPKRMPYVYAFVYWTKRSELLELHSKSRIHNRTKKVRLSRECRTLRKVINGEIQWDDPITDDPVVRVWLNKK